MSVATVTRYACARCGRRLPADKLCYSRHTGQRYCPLTDEKACDRRAKRQAKA